MKKNDQNSAFEQLLCQKLLELSQLSETLTLRILEAEERFDNIKGNKKIFESSSKHLSRQLLQESEEKLRNLKNLLAVDHAIRSLPKTSGSASPQENNLSQQNNDIESCMSSKPLTDNQQNNAIKLEDKESYKTNENNVNQYMDDLQIPLKSV